MITRRRLIETSGGAAAAALAGTTLDSSARAQGAGQQKVPIVYAAPGLAFASLYIANRQKLWQRNGIEPVLTHVEGGALGLVALNSGNANFACIASSDPLIAWDKGVRTQVVAAFYGALTVQVAARKDWMERVGVKASSPIEQKVKALKDARIGAATPGGGPVQYAKFMASLYGLDADRDIKVSAVGQGPARIAAIRENRVDVILAGQPEGDQVGLMGFGELYISLSTEVPLFKEFPFTVLTVTEEFAKKEPDQVRRVAQTIGAANDFVHASFDDAVALIKAEMPRIDPKAIELTMRRDKPAFAPKGRMTETMWANCYKLAQAMKSVKQTPPVKEGEFWTNKFLA